MNWRVWDNYYLNYNGLGQANQMFHRGIPLHYSSGEALLSRNSKYLDGIRAMVGYGITGSMVAAAASPMLIETLAPLMASKTGIDMTIEATWQAGNSLLFNGSLSQMDIADIRFAGIGGKYTYVFQAIVDFDAGGLKVAGANKNPLKVGMDLGIGRFNSWHSNEMKIAGVDKTVINFFNRVNQPLRITFVTGVKSIVKDE
ncbi:MAG: hypothetical protein ACXIUD_00655 [Mongoliitalea sp.]